MDKWNCIQYANLADIHARWAGVVPSSQWVWGSGKWATRKSPPPYCELMSIDAACRLPGAVGAAARRLQKARPRVQRVVAITNLRAARRALTVRAAQPVRVRCYVDGAWRRGALDTDCKGQR